VIGHSRRAKNLSTVGYFFPEDFSAEKTSTQND